MMKFSSDLSKNSSNNFSKDFSQISFRNFLGDLPGIPPATTSRMPTEIIPGYLPEIPTVNPQGILPRIIHRLFSEECLLISFHILMDIFINFSLDFFRYKWRGSL